VPTGAAADFATPSATVSPADCLIDTVHALRAPYRRGGPAWQMNGLTLARVRKFKDPDGRFIVRPGIEAGAPELLLGYPVVENEDMPDVAANAYPIAFAFWRRAYLIVDTMGTRVLRDPFTDKPNVLFYATRRVRGHVVNYEALKLVKVAAT
jgi:HK97 family phage major capsid protein